MLELLILSAVGVISWLLFGYTGYLIIKHTWLADWGTWEEPDDPVNMSRLLVILGPIFFWAMLMFWFEKGKNNDSNTGD